MIPRAIATIGVRIIAVLVLVQGLFGAVTLGSVMMRGLPQVRAHTEAAATELASSSERVRDSARTSAAISTMLLTVGVHFGVGVVLLLLSRPIGRLLARGVE